MNYARHKKVSVFENKILMLGALLALFLSMGQVSASETKNLPSAKPEKVGMSSDRLEWMTALVERYIENM